MKELYLSLVSFSGLVDTESNIYVKLGDIVGNAGLRPSNADFLNRNLEKVWSSLNCAAVEYL